MAGTYLEGTSKVLSGVYTLIKAAIDAVTMSARGIVAYPFTADWGPVNSLELNLYANEFNKRYNAANSALTAKKIYDQAFKGKPQQVLGYRMATGAVKGTCVLNDAGAAMSLTLETLYPSARAFVAVVKDALTGGKEVQITEGGILLVSVTGTTAAELETALNLTDYVRVTAKGANLPANSAGENFTGGNNGSVVTGTEYTAFLTALEADGRPNAFSFDATTDEAILTLAETWVKRVRDEGMYITWVRGGASAWDSDGGAAANAKSISLNHRGIVNVGNGCDGYTAAEMAIFIAARVASVALNRTLTDEVIDYDAVNKKLTPGERVTAKLAGTMVFTTAGNAVVIDEGVNTLTTPGADESKELGKIRVNSAVDQICKDLESFGDEYKKTRSNTDAARQTYAATVENTYFLPLQTMEVIQPGYFYRPDPEYHGKNAVFNPKIDEAFFYSDITPVDSMERIYQKIKLNF